MGYKMLAIGFDPDEVERLQMHNRLGDHVMRSSTAAAAVVNASRVDAVILDLLAPNADTRLVRRLRSAAPTVGVVAVAPPERTEEALTAGVHEVLVELHGVDELMTAAHRAVIRARAGMRAAPVTLDSVFGRVPAPMYRTLLNGEILQVNQPFADLLGAAHPTHLTGRSAADFYVDPLVRADLLELLRSDGIVAGREVALKRDDGSVVWCSVSSYIVKDGFGRPLYAEGVIIDVSDLVSERRRSTTAEEVYEWMFSHSPVPLWELDYSAVARVLTPVADGDEFAAHLEAQGLTAEDLLQRVELRKINRAAVRILQGEDDGTPSGTDAMPFSIADDNRVAIAQLEAIATGTDQFALDVPGHDRSGSRLDVRLLWLAGNFEDLPAYSRVVVAAVDETAMHDHRRGLERLVESKDAFISSVAHHLRTPLTAIFGFGSELHDHYHNYTESETKGMLGELVAAARAATNVVEDMAVAGRTELGTLAFQQDRVAIDCLAVEVVADLPVPVPIEGTCGPARADRARTRQILRALLSNAGQHGGDRVAVRLSEGADEVLVDVVDNGPGVPAEHEQLIFEPYVSRSANGVQPSPIGLGLSVARSLARQMEGDLQHVPGPETVFRLRLPRHV